MIRFVDGGAVQREFFAVCLGTAFGCKLAAIAKAYGFRQSFARFWAGEGAAYSLLDGQLSLAGKPEDWGEARAFLQALGPGQIFAPADAGQRLGLRAKTKGAVLEKALETRMASPNGFSEFRGGPPNLKEVYGLLERAGMALEWEPFYLDLSHRLRHEAALVLEEREGGALAGCAVISAVTEEAGLLSALAVKEGCRRKGIGSRLVQRTQALLAGRTLYVLRESGRNREFYRKLGFVETGRWMQT